MKIYKKFIFTESVRHNPRLGSPELAYVKTRSFHAPNFVAIPAMILIGVLGALVFSAFFALLLIPVAILTFRSGWMLRKLRGIQWINPWKGNILLLLRLRNTTSKDKRSPDEAELSASNFPLFRPVSNEGIGKIVHTPTEGGRMGLSGNIHGTARSIFFWQASSQRVKQDLTNPFVHSHTKPNLKDQ